MKTLKVEAVCPMAYETFEDVTDLSDGHRWQGSYSPSFLLGGIAIVSGLPHF
jgi:hypothetical protein